MSEPPPEVEVRLPEDRIVGDYANGMGSSVTQHELVLDFLINVDGPGMAPAVQLVRRVRIPIAMAADLLRHVGGAMDQYEQLFGPIHRPES